MKYGATLTREQLTRLALMSSENRAANALARTYPGGKDAFTSAMNRKAKALGMEQSRFTDAAGLDAGNVASPRDVVKMAGELGTEPVLVIAASETDPGILPMPLDSSHVFNRHFEYAMTWFLFAATWVVMTGFALWRIRRQNG